MQHNLNRTPHTHTHIYINRNNTEHTYTPAHIYHCTDTETNNLHTISTQHAHTQTQNTEQKIQQYAAHRTRQYREKDNTEQDT